MCLLPFTTSPLGWLILGISGYSLYKAGKKKGTNEVAASKITKTQESEQTKN